MSTQESKSSDPSPSEKPKTSYGIIFGRLVSAFRSETLLNQIAFSKECHLSTGALARIEAGRNVATIDHIVSIEYALLDRDLIDDCGDLLILVDDCLNELRELGIRVIRGKLALAESCPITTIDRVVGKVVLDWKRQQAERAAKQQGGDDENDTEEKT